MLCIICHSNAARKIRRSELFPLLLKMELPILCARDMLDLRHSIDVQFAVDMWELIAIGRLVLQLTGQQLRIDSQQNDRLIVAEESVHTSLHLASRRAVNE